VLIESLERQIRNTSEIIVRASLLVNEVLHCNFQHNYNRPVENQVALSKLGQTFVTACFTEGLKLHTNYLTRLTAKSSRIFSGINFNPYVHLSSGDYKVITMGAQFYSTNLAASTWTSFVGRQRDFVQFWLQDHGLASQEVSAYCAQ